MKQMIRWITAAFILVVALVLWRLDATRPTVDMPRAATGSEDDPEARTRFEWMRLHDPATGLIPANMRARELAFANTLPVRYVAGKTQAASWNPRGPYNVGGRTRALAYDMSDATGNTILAGGISGGIFKTTDGGATWTQTFGPTQLHSVTTIVQDTRSGHTGTWYAGTGENIGNSTSGTGAFFLGDGLFKSTDGGSSWTALASTVSGTPVTFENLFDIVWELAIDPSNTVQDEVYTATFGAIFQSLDGGTSWTAVLSPAGSFSNATDVHVSSTGVVYAALDGGGAGAGVSCSPTGGSGTYLDMTPAFFPAAGTYGRIELALNAAETELWAVALTTGATGAVSDHMLGRYSVPSSGACNTGSWVDYTAGIPNRGGLTGSMDSQGGYDLLLAVHPANANILYLGDINIWRLDVSAGPAGVLNTRVGGYEVTNSTFALYQDIGATGDTQHPDQQSLSFSPANNSVMLIGSDGGVYRTDDNLAGSSGSAGDGAVVWHSLNNGYLTTQFYDVCFNPDDTDATIIGGAQDNGTWSTGSSTLTDAWVDEFGGDGAYCGILNNTGAGTGTSRYVSSQNGNIYRSVYNSAGTNTGLTNVSPTGASGFLFVNPFVLATGSHLMYLPAGSALWRNSDLEAIPLFSDNTTSVNWTQMTGSTTPDGSTISAVEVVNDTLYFGTSTGRIFRLDGVSTAAAATVPVEITNGAFPAAYVSGIAVNPNDVAEVLVTVSNYSVASVFHAPDGTSATPTWADVEGNLSGEQGPSVRRGAILPISGGARYYVATSVGLYSTTTLAGGSTVWAQEGPSTIGNVVVDDVAARASDGLVLVGTHGNGIYSSTVSLPVELAGFDAVVDGETIVLNWQTASESGNAGFEVEHRLDQAESFEREGFVDGAGSSPDGHSYSFRFAASEPGRHVFRLKQVDFEGSFTYSEEVEAFVSLPDSYRLTGSFPNPFSTSASFNLAVQEAQHVRVEVFNTAGRRVAMLHDGLLPANETRRFTIEGAGLPGGLYFYRAVGETFSVARSAVLLK